MPGFTFSMWSSSIGVQLVDLICPVKLTSCSFVCLRVALDQGRIQELGKGGRGGKGKEGEESASPFPNSWIHPCGVGGWSLIVGLYSESKFLVPESESGVLNFLILELKFHKKTRTPHPCFPPNHLATSKQNLTTTTLRHKKTNNKTTVTSYKQN